MGFFFSSEAMILFPCTNMPPCFSLLLHLLFLLTLGLLYVTSHQGKPIAINHEGEVSCHYAISTLNLDRRIMISKIQQNEHYPQCTKFVMITPPWGVGGGVQKIPNFSFPWHHCFILNYGAFFSKMRIRSVFHLIYVLPFSHMCIQ